MAEQVLEVDNSRSREVPKTFLEEIRDHWDDCRNEAVDALGERLEGPLSLDPSRWHDHTGQELTRASLTNIYSGAGCSNCCDPRQASVKIHLREAGQGSVLVVRLWEPGQN
jgi:hypothetical protein